MKILAFLIAKDQHHQMGADFCITYEMLLEPKILYFLWV